MWPVQTITLLLCLTDEEQLFAQQVPQDREVPAVEVQMENTEEDLPATSFVLDPIG
jgi:hypothetical protein